MNIPKSASIYTSVSTVNCTEVFVKKTKQSGADGYRLIAKGTSPEKVKAVYLKTCSLIDNPSNIILDLPGDKPRLASKVPEVLIKTGQKVIFSFDQKPTATNLITVGTKFLANYQHNVKVGDRLIIKVGNFTFRVTKVNDRGIETALMNKRSIRLSASRSISLPDSNVSYGILSESDEQLLKSLQDCSDLVLAVSMVESAADIDRVKKLVPRANIIAKIESRKSIQNIEAIIKRSSSEGGVMLARGDLSVEFTPTEFVEIVKAVTSLCKKYNCRLYLATWLLYSLTFRDSPSPDNLTDIMYFFEKGCRDFIISGEPSSERPLDSLTWLKQILAKVKNS